MRFVKGHGAGNDFVLLVDPDGELALSTALVRALCDRQRGIGADGVLRCVRAAAAPEAAGLAAGAEWFMDHRNADGSPAEMCGNGIRVFARYLVRAGLARAGEVAVATRAGVRRVEVTGDGAVTVAMGPVRLAGGTATVRLAGRWRAATVVSVGNPHAVVLLRRPVDELDLTGVELSGRPVAGGANVEVVNRTATDRLRMRVVERGVGETRSCGTGACAAAAVAADGARSTWRVTTPGGELAVTLDDGQAWLRGPAVLVGGGELCPEWLAGATATAG